ncbi:hypothetical protein [Vibrio sp.]|uniref:hypothetical protein n=1 Tax=Vibrio sp. TaxID=678 RepID=UPI003D110723
MTERITQESDPLLWAALQNSYFNEGKPRNVVRAGKMYAVHTALTEELVFTEVDTMDYIDSRSLKRSRKASYNKLKE